MNESIQNEIIKKERAAYLREWRRKNPDKHKAIQERYWLKRAATRAEMEKEEWKNATTQV